MKLKKIISILFVFSVLFSIYAENTKPWINSNIIENVTKNTPTNLKDDFSLYVNKDWLLNTEVPSGQIYISGTAEHKDILQKNIISVLEGKDASFYEGKLAQTFYKTYIDMKTRNKLGVKPLMPFIKEIQNIKTLEDLTNYLLREDQLSNKLFDTEIQPSFNDSSKKAVCLSPISLSLSNAKEYKNPTEKTKRIKDAKTEKIISTITYAGFSKKEAKKIVNNMFMFEEKIAFSMFDNEIASSSDYFTVINNNFTLKELQNKTKNFPICEILAPYTKAGISNFVVTEPKYFEKLDELYIEENIELIKAKLMCDNINYSNLLNQTCIDICDKEKSTINGKKFKSNLKNDAYTLTNSFFIMAIGQMYVENFVSPQMKEKVTNICNQIVNVYRTKLAKNDWLNKETCKKAIEKLDAITFYIAYPDDWSIYEKKGLVLKENSTIIDNIITINQYQKQKDISEFFNSRQQVWAANIGPQTINAFYNPTNNSISILSGFMNGIVYQPEYKDEQLLATVGMIMGHEITHAFDQTGSQFDKDGNLNTWWTKEDSKNFAEKTSKVIDYFSTIEVFPGRFLDGAFTLGENVADLGSLKCLMQITKQYENFDYDLFFKTYARLWSFKWVKKGAAEAILLEDTHSPGYVRCNAVLQQLQEFYDTYNIKEGDGMYLAPEKRVSVW